MRIEYNNKFVNPLFNRTEVNFVIVHGGVTPSRKNVIQKIAEEFKSPEDLIILDYIRQPFGVKRCFGRAKVYKDEGSMKIEPKHLVARAGKALGKEVPKKEKKKKKSKKKK
jgi:ribosomal protein S24E